MENRKEGKLSGKIIGCAIEVHRQLGPGLLESVYEECLCFELKNSGLTVARQHQVSLQYKQQLLESKLRVDLLVNDEIIVELKSVKRLEPIHEAQFLTYLKLTNKKYGLLINFNTNMLKQGIKRLVN